ncbi:hypothetical protein [Amycolatopsis minnesotensis]
MGAEISGHDDRVQPGLAVMMRPELLVSGQRWRDGLERIEASAKSIKDVLAVIGPKHPAVQGIAAVQELLRDWREHFATIDADEPEQAQAIAAWEQTSAFVRDLYETEIKPYFFGGRRVVEDVDSSAGNAGGSAGAVSDLRHPARGTESAAGSSGGHTGALYSLDYTVCWPDGRVMLSLGGEGSSADVARMLRDAAETVERTTAS